VGRHAFVLLSLLVACTAPKLTHCPDVDCPGEEVCGDNGGCVLPAQLTACLGVGDATDCSYANISGASINGQCTNGVCLPAGCGNNIVNAGEACDDGNNTSGDGCSADCLSNETCGNGVVDPASGEQCDDGNSVDGDGCQHDCKLPRCGDGVVDPTLNEQCDAGDLNSNDPDAPCRKTCQVPRCGDGIIDVQHGEVCDDKNNTSGDGCSGDCKSDETCGNRIIDTQAGEVCDDGNHMSGDGCSADCKSNELCGNHVIDTSLGEVCDDGNTVSGDGCSSDCKSLEQCGDGYVNTIDEQCDLGSNNSDAPDSACRTNCKLPACGDGIVDTAHGEACDNGMANANTANACRTNCQLPRCGDHIMDTGEICDDGNNASGDGCSGDCKSTEMCGNGIVDTAKGEQCDSSGVDTATCVGSTCKLSSCGDGHKNTAAGEQCDSSGVDTATCVGSTCKTSTCGDGHLNTLASEQCDSGGNDTSTCVGSTCKTSSCGDGHTNFAAGEQCDSSGVDSATCVGGTCKLSSCGDGYKNVAAGEQCDSSGVDSATCVGRTCKTSTCGDGYTNTAANEQCDSSGTDTVTCVGSTCKTSTCGDGHINMVAGEQCESGGVDTTTCVGSTCKTSTCGDGHTNTVAGEQCDSNGFDSPTCIGTTCKTSRCGDNYTNFAAGEQCDTGSSANTATCLGASCKISRCGDTVVNAAAGEQCDSGGSDNATCVGATCKTSTCGDGHVNAVALEQCDTGGADTASCVGSTCKTSTCGDGHTNVAGQEQCDDGNGTGRDGCSTCKVEDVVGIYPNQNLQYYTDVAAAYDAGRKRVVMFYYGSTFEWDGVSWTQMQPRHTPSSRYGEGLAYDPKLHRIIMFGGYYNSYKQDTWSWDGQDWTDVSPSSGALPDARYETSMAYDPNRGHIILYGGYTSGSGYAETWEWTGTAWNKLTVTGSPGQRCGHNITYDDAHGYLLMYGGGCTDNHTWVFNGATLTWTDKGASTVDDNYKMYMAYDASRAAVVLWDKPGTTWEWNGTSWLAVTAATPITDTTVPNVSYGAMAYDAARNQLVTVGGYGCQNAPPYNCIYPSTWTRSGTTWTQAPTYANPPGRGRAAAAYDPVRARVVMFGGQNQYCMSCSPFPNTTNDTWEWDGHKWTQNTNAVPAQLTIRAGQWMVYDKANSVMKMFAGGNYDGNTFSWYGQLYSYNGTSWTLNDSSRTGLRGTGLAYDINNSRTVSFAGADGTTRTNLNDTWYYDATGWHTAAITSKPPVRRDTALAYDPIRGRTVMFGGEGNSGNLGDVWEWDGGANWQSFSVTGPAPRRGFELNYNPDTQSTLLFGNNPTGSEDLWEWNGSTWTNRSYVNPNGQVYRAATAWDAARHQLLLFGGKNYQTNFQLLQYRPWTSVEACTFSTLDYDGDGLAGCADPDCWSVCYPLCPPGSPASCKTSGSRCGDGTCNAALEDNDICPSDCTTGPSQVCGDYRCTGTETHASCPNDC
jgi:cysteine-rich repeat protein